MAARLNPAQTQPAIAVLGAGAIGSLFAAALAQAERPVQLLLRPGAKTADSLEFTSLSGALTQLPLSVLPPEAMCAVPDILLVCTKAQQVAGALATCIDYCHARTAIVLLHNGMGVLEQLPTEVRARPVYSAVTTQAAHRARALAVRHMGSGETVLGPSLNADFASAQTIARVLSTDTCPVTAVDDIAPLQWRKLAINCALNPLTALYDCCNGEVGEHPQARVEQQALVEEIMRVSAGMGAAYALPDLAAQLQRVMRDTYPNPNSMRCDIKAGLPSEISHINGYLIERAAALGIDTPHNRDILRRIRALESR